jgi:CubicO group peptidase (beta-lactamase class C family)
VIVVRIVLACAGLLAGVAAAEARQQQDAPAARIGAIFAEWGRPDSPGCGVGVSRNGESAFERGYGMADVEAKVPITPTTVFHIASISKQFTAMSILLLVQRGRLSLDDEVRKHIPEWADQGSRVTIRHLLSHTGGLRDGFLLLQLIPPDEKTDINDAIVRIVARQRGLNFPPGTEFQYSNSGYVVLANIVKRVSGRSLRAFADVNIFKPLGMAQTHVHDDPAIAVPDRAVGYRRSATGVSRTAHADLGRLVGTTGVLTTVRDMLVWHQNFTRARVGEPALLAAMQTPMVLADGTTAPYGFGLWIEPDGDLRTIGHGGGDPGYAGHVRRYPDRGIAVAVLCNLEDVGTRVGELTRRVARVFLGEDVTTSSAPLTSAPPAVVTLSAEQLAGKAGLYRDVASGAFGRIFLRDGKLRAAEGAGKGEADSVELNALAANRFIIPGTPFIFDFVPGQSGEAVEVHISGQDPKPAVLRKLPEFSPSMEELRALAGDYRSADLNVTYRVVVRDSRLVVQIPGRADAVLDAVVPDTFTGGVLDTLRFLRGADGSVIAAALHSSGVRGLRFDRIPNAVRVIREARGRGQPTR